jgi:hypothetical protein
MTTTMRLIVQIDLTLPLAIALTTQFVPIVRKDITNGIYILTNYFL